MRIDGAEQATSDALLVIKDGRVLVEREAAQLGRRAAIDRQQVAALRHSRLVADGAIASIDAPLSTFFRARSATNA
jgi:hypothetical protein